MTQTITTESLQADIELMDTAALELARISERSEFALSVVTQSIRTQEAIAKGKVLRVLRDQIPDGEWMKFLNREDVRIEYTHALNCINAAQVVEEASPVFGEEILLQTGPSVLSKISTLPTDSKLEMLELAVERDKPITQKEVEAERAKPETKLSKATEKLADAKAQRDEKLAEGASKADVKNETKNINRLEARILQLESDLEKEKGLKTELSDGLTSAEDDLHKAQKRLEIAQSELANALEESQKLRFDEDTAKAQRISRVGNQLILTLPQTLADVQKFVADREDFQGKTKSTIENQIYTLIAYLNEHFDQNAPTE